MSENRNRSNNITNFSERDTNKSQIGHSGNSDVDVEVNVIVDTTALAYAYLCSMLATNKMTNDEFDIALKKLKELTKHKDKKDDRKKNDERHKYDGRNKKSEDVRDIDYYRERRRRLGY